MAAGGPFSTALGLPLPAQATSGVSTVARATAQAAVVVEELTVVKEGQ